VDAIAGLTAVDGAVEVTDQHELLGFGAKITRRKRWPQGNSAVISQVRKRFRSSPNKSVPQSFIKALKSASDLG
jgi:hypothetical protein